MASLNQTTINYGDKDNDKNIALVALVVSVIALFGTLLQVGQQYLASAAGYSSCDESVIGPWHKTKKRQFRFSEMRFRVLFKSPVFFVCPASNTRGPVLGAPIYLVRGTEKSIKKTLSLPLSPTEKELGQLERLVSGSAQVLSRAYLGFQTTLASIHRPVPVLYYKSSQGDTEEGSVPVHDENDDDDEIVISGTNDSLKGSAVKSPTGLDAATDPVPDKGSVGIKGIHTVDSESATWLRLLQELHRMEHDSRKWELSQVSDRTRPDLDRGNFKHHQLCVAVQGKQHSWDTMPPSVNRPYATTTMCHIVEMAAMLGLYWKEFDRSTRHFRAEGNGYVLSGSRIADFGGIFFSFQISGKTKFEENRIIPADEAKEYAFGLVPTIFRKNDDMRRLVFSVEDMHNSGTLLLGSPKQFAETLASVGCNARTSAIVRDRGLRDSHLFPLAFELVGMVGKRLHRTRSPYRFLPNPTYAHWDKKNFSMRLLLEAYSKEIRNLSSDDGRVLFLRRAVAKIIRIEDQELAEIRSLKDKSDQGFQPKLMNALGHYIDICDRFLRSKGRAIVLLALSKHIQEVVHMVNNKPPYRAHDHKIHVQDGSVSEHTHLSVRRSVHSAPSTAPQNTAGMASLQNAAAVHVVEEDPYIRDLNESAPSERQATLMGMYFKHVRPRVIMLVDKESDDWAPMAAKEEQDDTDRRLTTGWADYRPAIGEPVDVDDFPPAKRNVSDAEAIWCTLVFRMLCWLTLHDFNKADVQKEKSELLGSRLPVFIR